MIYYYPYWNQQGGHIVKRNIAGDAVMLCIVISCHERIKINENDKVTIFECEPFWMLVLFYICFEYNTSFSFQLCWSSTISTASYISFIPFIYISWFYIIENSESGWYNSLYIPVPNLSACSLLEATWCLGSSGWLSCGAPPLLSWFPSWKEPFLFPGPRR